MDRQPQIIRIAEIKNMSEYIETLPSELEDEREKLIELIKKSNGKKINEAGYVVVTWDPDLCYGETRLFTKEFDEIDI